MIDRNKSILIQIWIYIFGKMSEYSFASEK